MNRHQMKSPYGQWPDLSCFDPVGLAVGTPHVNKAEDKDSLNQSQSLLPAKSEELSPFSKETKSQSVKQKHDMPSVKTTLYF